ncbi:MAG: AbrB/MazE/SpoVT family DNA-binding domain-containing protein [Deltaproteobacteria bacterium]|nr:AbrB/MazE/SpoVT family DNA-binding domain-containing protein [Deltaproteobacteria bacterium]
MADVVTIDAAGRLVIPKAIRARLQLRDGSRLEIREEGGRILLEQVADAGVPVEVEGLLVIRGRLLREVPDHRELRADRIRSLGGVIR